MQFFRILAVVLYLSPMASVVAHGIHSAEEMAEDLQSYDFYMTEVLKELQAFARHEATGVERNYFYLNKVGEKVKFSRSDLANALVKQFKLMSGGFRDGAKKSCGACKSCTCVKKLIPEGTETETALSSTKIVRSMFEKALNKSSDWLKESVIKFKHMGILLPGAAARLLNEYDPLTLIAMGVLWPIYTPISELAESMVMGFAHIYCVASQILFFRVMGMGNRTFMSSYLALTEKSKPMSAAERLHLLRLSLVGARSIKKHFEQVMNMPKTMAMDREIFRTAFSNSFDDIERQILSSPFWSDLWQVKYNSAVGKVTSSEETDLDFIFSDRSKDTRLARVMEHYEGMELMARIANEISQLKRLTKATTTWQNMKDQFYQGHLTKLLLSYRTALLIAASSDNFLERANKRNQLKQVTGQILKVFEILLSNDPEILLKRSAELKILKKSLQEYRSGDNCSANLVSLAATEAQISGI